MAFQSELHSHKVEPDSVPVGLVEAAQPIEHRCPARFRTVKPDWHRATPGLVPDARWAWAGVTKRTGKLLIRFGWAGRTRSLRSRLVGRCIDALVGEHGFVFRLTASAKGYCVGD